MIDTLCEVGGQLLLLMLAAKHYSKAIRDVTVDTEHTWSRGREYTVGGGGQTVCVGRCECVREREMNNTNKYMHYMYMYIPLCTMYIPVLKAGHRGVLNVCKVLVC